MDKLIDFMQKIVVVALRVYFRIQDFISRYSGQPSLTAHRICVATCPVIHSYGLASEGSALYGTADSAPSELEVVWVVSKNDANTILRDLTNQLSSKFIPRDVSTQAFEDGFTNFVTTKAGRALFAP